MTRDQLVMTSSSALGSFGSLALGRIVRPIATLLAAGSSILFVAGPGCAEEGIGDPCIPEQEYDPNFLGFAKEQVSVESRSFQCRTRLCLVNHFLGRVSCPYGQSANGEAPTGAPDSCRVPGTTTPIEGPKDPTTQDFVDAKKSTVEAQCVDRTADKAVYCSCRCADINGQRPSDQAFCDCPDGFACERLVTSIGQGNEGLTGSYCIKQHTNYDPATACTQGQCDPSDKTRSCN